MPASERCQPISVTATRDPPTGMCRRRPSCSRELTVLANVDSELCALVAAGLGLPAPDGTPPADVVVSPACLRLSSSPTRSPAARSA
jgi:hypothetical protein